MLEDRQASILTVIAAITMLLGPLAAALTDALLTALVAPEQREADDFSDAHGSVLVIGFGRFGQIVSQCLLAEGVDVTTIDNDPEMIQQAARFGFKVYYGDGTRLDVLRAAGAAEATLVAICIDHREAASRIVDLVQPGVSRHQALRSLLRSPPHAATPCQGRRLRAARDLRIRAGVRPHDARRPSASIRDARRR